MPLKGIKVIELAGLAPAPFCGMILSDFGATVTRVDRIPNNPIDCLKEGKRNIAIDMKKSKGRNLVRSLCKISDVLIEPYRPGVMEKLGLGPDVLLKDNPRLIYARLTGFGQDGPLSGRAGHDINYVALSGVLSFLGRKNEKPTAPINLIADFAGGGLLCAFGIVSALLARHKTGQGQIIDSSMTEGAAYIGSWLTRSQELPIWGNKRGKNILDTGAHYYDTYKTKDGKFMSVGCLEVQFYQILVDTLNVPDGFNQHGSNEDNKEILEKLFLTKTQKEWSEIFDNTDACVFPVLDWKDADEYSHNKYRQTFVDKKMTGGKVVPNPAPRLNKTPAISSVLRKQTDDEWSQIQKVLSEIGLNVAEMNQLCEEKVILLNQNGKL